MKHDSLYNDMLLTVLHLYHFSFSKTPVKTLVFFRDSIKPKTGRNPIRNGLSVYLPTPIMDCDVDKYCTP